MNAISQSLGVSPEQISRCHRLPDGTYQVRSESTSAVYTTGFTDGRWHCSCPCGAVGFVNSHTGVCKHTRWVACAESEYREEQRKLEERKLKMVEERSLAGDVKRANGKTARHYYLKCYLKSGGLGTVYDLGYRVEAPLSQWEAVIADEQFDLAELFRSGRRWLVSDKREAARGAVPARELAPLNGNKAFSLMR